MCQCNVLLSDKSKCVFLYQSSECFTRCQIHKQPPKPFPSLLPWKLCFFIFFPHVCCFPFSFYSSRRSLLFSIYCPPHLLFLVCLFISSCKPIVYALVHMHLYVLQASVYCMESCSIARTLPYIQYDDHINSQSGYR